jgi:translocation protein SEC62
MASGNGGNAKNFYEDEKNLMKLCDFLRSSEGPPVREAVEMDKRVYYIKGARIMAHFSR